MNSRPSKKLDDKDIIFYVTFIMIVNSCISFVVINLEVLK